MSTQLDWQFGEDTDEQPPERRRWPLSSLATLIVLVGTAVFILAGWQVGQEQAERANDRLLEQVQTVLDQQRAAFLAGDGELFFSNLAHDPGWQATQLRPFNQQLLANELTVTRAEQHGNHIWASVRWFNAAGAWQRVAFFQWQQGRLVQLPTVDNYWENRRSQRQPWGEISYYERDETFALAVAGYVAEVVAELCPAAQPTACRAESRPFKVILAGDELVSAVPNEIRLPSPRLVALTEAGQPAEPFWQMVRRQLEAQLTPAAIRFAVPEEDVVAYERAAGDFTALWPDIAVEIVALESLPADPVEWTALVDGASVRPDERMLAAGLLYDLTDLAGSDPNFEAGDFYEQIWQGVWWRERMWLMPQSAGLQLIYYDKEAFALADRPEPSLRWTWTEMAEDLAALDALHGREEWAVAFMDISRDILLAYAFNQAHQPCGGTVGVLCGGNPDAGGVAAALAWYQTMQAEPGRMLDLAGLPPAERARAKYNDRAMVWVDSPVNYEHWLLLRSVGLVPFPGSELFDGVTPLWVNGSFISSSSERPLAAWQWLKFLTYRRLQRQWRLIPARPSVATDSGYWFILPRPVSDALRTAFPFAWPVPFEAQQLFGEAQLTAVTSGAQSPAEAAQTRERLDWFNVAE